MTNDNKDLCIKVLEIMFDYVSDYTHKVPGMDEKDDNGNNAHLLDIMKYHNVEL